LHHVEGLCLDTNVQADMAQVRSKTGKTASPAPAALIGIVRLLARQAAHEWAEAAQEEDRRPESPAILPPEKQR
jgi:hypothetical protein